MSDSFFNDPYLKKLKRYFWPMTMVSFVAALYGLYKLSIYEEWDDGSLAYAVIFLVIFCLAEAANNEPESLYDYPKPKAELSRSTLGKICVEQRAIWQLLWKKIKWWGVAFIIVFGIHECHMDQMKQIEAEQRWQKMESERMTRKAWESAAKHKAKEDSIKKSMKYKVVRTHSDGSYYDGYQDGLDAADLDHEIGGQYRQNYEDSGNGDDYDQGYEDGYDDGDW